jgi:hypothetical protein
MSNYLNLAAEAGDKYLAMLAQSQDQIIEFVRSSRELMPHVPASYGAQFSEMPFPVPSPRDLADAQFEFASRLLKQQEGFTRKLYQLPSGKTPAKAASSTRQPSKSASATRSAAKGRSSRKPKASS